MVQSINLSSNGLILQSFSKTSKKQEDNLNQLATGKQKANPADNAVGAGKIQNLAKAIKAIEALDKSIATSSGAISTAESALGQTTSQLQSLRELAVQAADSTLSQSQRSSIAAQASEITQAIDDTASRTEFDGTKLLDGSFTDKNIQVGTRAGDKVSVSISAATTEGLGIDSIDLSTPEGAESAIEAIDAAIQNSVSSQNSLGSVLYGLENRQAVNERASAVLSSVRSTIEDLDVAKITGDIKTQDVKQQLAMKLLKIEDDTKKNSFGII